MNDQPRTRNGGHRVGQHYTKEDNVAATDSTIRTGCRENLEDFVAVENLLSSLIQLGLDAAAAPAPDAERISTALAWCRTCPIQSVCYRRMSHYGYTGLAGGKLLLRGEQYIPRKANKQLAH